MDSTFDVIYGGSSFVCLLDSLASLLSELLASLCSASRTSVPDVWAWKHAIPNDRRRHELGKEYGRCNHGHRSVQCRRRVAASCQNVRSSEK